MTDKITPDAPQHTCWIIEGKPCPHCGQKSVATDGCREWCLACTGKTP